MRTSRITNTWMQRKVTGLTQNPQCANTKQSKSDHNNLLFYPHQTTGCNKDYRAEHTLVLLSRLFYFGG